MAVSRRTPCVGAALGFAFVACGRGDGTRDGIPHPNAANAPPADAVLITSGSVPVGMSEGELAAWSAARDALFAATPVLRLGSEQRGPELFGYVPKADIAADGNIVVLDELAQEIRVFDPQGRFIDGFGGMGDGPLELRYAVDFQLFRDGRIAVPLGKFGQIKVFARQDTGWALLEHRTPPANDLCAMDDGRWFSAGYLADDDKIINEYLDADSLDDEGVEDSGRSFGSGYVHEHRFIRRALSDGLVECIGETDALVFGFSKLPMIRSYGTDGGLKWVAAIDDEYIQLEVLEVRHPESGRVGYGEETRFAHDRLAELEAVGNGRHVLLQYARVLPDERRVVPRSYLLDTNSGRGAFIGDSLPVIVSVQPDGYVTLAEEPYVHLEVWKFNGGRRGSGR